MDSEYIYMCYPLPDPICYPLAVYISLRAQMGFDEGFLFKFEFLNLTGLYSLGRFARRSLSIIRRRPKFSVPFKGKGLAFFDYSFSEPWSRMHFG